MIDNKIVLGLIPARGGSKGIKDKNIVDLCGKPLISYTIDAAKKSKYIDDVVISTDSEKIAKVANEYGAEVPFLRPESLATDTAKTIDAVISAIEMLQEMGRTYDILVLLQPTQPLRTSYDIDEALEKFLQNEEKGLVSICQANESPLLVRSLNENGEMKKLLEISSTCRRQDMPTFYKINGCIYINSISSIDNELSFNDNPIPYIMPKERSIDIDEMEDLILAEYYLK